ncbi:hypothetical protein [Diaphorobacter ruginosibacter]|uniref:hypothetical protein n=1 Tax=Diaphorobacter ruginosibacter TaxID=1715720 RepID=UPI0033408C54
MDKKSHLIPCGDNWCGATEMSNHTRSTPSSSDLGVVGDSIGADELGSGVFDSFGVEKGVSAASALQPDIVPVLESGLQHRLDSIAQARLAKEIRRFRGAWLLGPALLWGDIHPIRRLPIPDVDKRIATALARGFLQCSNLLAHFEILVQELEKTGLVSEERVLSLENLVANSGCFFGDEIEVSDSHHCGDHVLRDAQGGRGNGEM